MPFLCAAVYRPANTAPIGRAKCAKDYAKSVNKRHKDIFFYSSFFLYDSFALLVLIRCNLSAPEE